MTIIATAVVLLALAETSTADTDLWEYSGPFNASTWPLSNPICGKMRQSPINICTENAERVDLPPLNLSEYDDDHDCSMELMNNGKSAEVKYECAGDPITISGGNLPGRYVLEQFHFHWGSNSTQGSEHLVDGIAAPMEMHLVHRRDNIGNFPIQFLRDGLAVLSFLFKVGNFNQKFDELLLSKFKSITNEGEMVKVEPFELSELLPESISSGYYRYFGSLTTPPCFETVIWSVFKDRIEISEDQLNTFRALRTMRAMENDDDALVDNFRPTQKLNGRLVSTNRQTD